MLIQGEDEGGFSLDDGKSAEQVSFFSTEVCGADFHQRSVTVVEFGSRPAKRARLLSDTDDPVKEAQFSSFDRRGLVQGEKSNGDFGGMLQAHQADEPMSESSSGVTNGLRSRSAGMKVAGTIHATDYVEKRVNTKIVSEQKSGSQEDEKRILLNHENMNGNAGCTIHSMQEVVDDTTSTSGDEGLFVIQVRSPTSKQLLHGRNQSNDQEELHSCCGDARSQIAEPHDPLHNPDTLVHCHEDGRIVGCCPHKSVEVGDKENTKLDAEKVESSVEVANAKLVGAESKVDICRETDDLLIEIQAADLRSKGVNGLTDDQLSKGSPRSRSDVQYTEHADANEYHNNGPICPDAKSPVITDTCTSSKAGVHNEVEIKEAKTTDMEGLAGDARVFREDTAPICIQEDIQATSNLPDEVEAATAAELVTESSANLNLKKCDANLCPSEQVNLQAVQDQSASFNMNQTISSDQCDPSSVDNIGGKDGDHQNIHEQVEHSTPQVQEFVPAGMENSEKVIQEASAVGVSDTRCEEEPCVNSSEILNVYVRKRKRNTPAVVVTVDSATLQEYGSSKSEDACRLQLKGEDPLGERVIKHYVRRPHRQTDSHSPAEMIEKPSEHVLTSANNGGKESVYSLQAEHHTDMPARLETEGNLNVFQRRPKKNHSPEADHHSDISARVESEGNLNVFQRRSKMNHSPQVEHHTDDSTPKTDVARVESEGNLNVFQRRPKKNPLPHAEHHTDVSVRFETQGNLNVFQRRSKTNLSQKEPSKYDIIGLQNEVTEKHTPAGYVQAEYQPKWLPEGWILEIREGKTTAHPRDKYYHDHKSGHIFRSKNEVLKFLEDERVGRGQMRSDGIGTKVLSQNKKRLPVPSARAKQTGFQSPLSKPSLSTQTRLVSQEAPSPPFTHMHPARMKTTPVRPTSAVSSEANGTDMTWAHVKGPNGPIWLPWGGAFGTGTSERCQGDKPAKHAGASALHGGAANNPQLLSSGDGVQLPTGSPVSAVKSPSDQGDKENRGKLIFRLKRKQPDSEGGRGRSKRPMYEVVHGEKASSSTSTPTKQEKKLITGERTGQDVYPTPDSVQMHLQRISSVKESLSPNVVSGSMSVKPQVEKHIPLEKPSFTSPSPLVMPTVDRTPDQSVASSFKATSFERSRRVPGSMVLEQLTAMKPGLKNPTMSNWGIKHNPLQHPSQQLELLQQEPYTALGIPATARSSGLQQMASYSANHTHVFLDPVDNTIPLSWQYPFTSQASTPVTASVPTLGPFPSFFAPSVSMTFSSTVPIPIFEHFPGVSSFKNLNATATMFPCSESGIDSRTRDSASNAKLAAGVPQVHKALTAPKPLTKAEHTKLFLGLGRRLCLAGVEQKTRNPESVGTWKPHLESQIPATNL